jgi:hypothetical protein
MTDAQKQRQEKRSSVATSISFCPHLGLYHYTRADGVDYLFDTKKLEEAIDAYLKSGDAKQADFMATLTGVARLHPHKIVSFDEEGKCSMSDLVAESSADDSSNGAAAPSKIR